jgi:hypothetical protein
VQPTQAGAGAQRNIDGELYPSATGLTAVHVHQQVSKHIQISDGLLSLRTSIAQANDNGLRKINSCKPGSEHLIEKHFTPTETVRDAPSANRPAMARSTSHRRGHASAPSALPKRTRGGISPDLGLRACNDNKVPLIRNTGIRRVDAERRQGFTQPRPEADIRLDQISHEV